VVADDDPVAAMRVAQVLRHDGFEVEVVSAGGALSSIRSGRAGLAIVNWMMAGRDGLEICRRVEEEGGATRTILMAGRRFVEALRTEVGLADGYLPKPLSSEGIRRAVREAGVRLPHPPPCGGDAGDAIRLPSHA
jgi:two-component system OmpR family response regulator